MQTLGTKNTTTQNVPSGGAINLGANYRVFLKNFYGVKPIVNTGTSINFNQAGFYHATATIVGTLSTAGDLIINLVENGTNVLSSATETITTANTEIRTLVIDYIISSDTVKFLLGMPSVAPESIAFINASADEAIINSIVVNIGKEV